MIRITDLDFSYGSGDFRLHVPELGVTQGAKTAVIGPSGTGKTTLLGLVAGVLVPSSGKVVVDDVDLSELSEARRRDYRIRRIGLVFQEFELLEHLNVLDNVLLPFRITSALRLSSATRDRALTLLDRVGIGDKRRRYVRHLSQGERQRVAVCRALLPEPPVLLCDEPTGNLDPENKGRVLDIILDYVDAHGTTLLTVTHDHELLPRFDVVVDFEPFRRSGSGGS